MGKSFDLGWIESDMLDLIFSRSWLFTIEKVWHVAVVNRVNKHCAFDNCRFETDWITSTRLKPIVYATGCVFITFYCGYSIRKCLINKTKIMTKLHEAQKTHNNYYT